MDNCPLCAHTGKVFYQNKDKNYFRCQHCDAIYLDSGFLPSPSEELQRYRSHNNDVNDPRYQRFVSPITQTVIREFEPKHKGLDYGSGSGPVILKLLTAHHFDIVPYDPYFANRPEVLKNTYHYIVCCEVMEHFHSPHEEFLKLSSLLLPNGKLYCMTHLYDDTIEFDSWYYKNDLTHVLFYTRKTLDYIATNYGFKSLYVKNRLIVFTK